MTEDSQFEQKVLSIIAEALPSKRDQSTLAPGTRLQRDLGLDSIRILGLMFRLGEAFKVDIVSMDLRVDVGSLRTVGDVLDLGRNILGRTNGARA
jgi:acyl carrier protein